MKSELEVVRPSQKMARSSRKKTGLARRRLGHALLIALMAIIGLVAWSGWYLRSETAYNMHNLIRLHVVANSDQPADQQVKLEVRDAILGASGDLFSAKPPDEAVQVVKDNLPLFKRIAENVLRANGYDYPVNVEYGTFAFPERAYGPLVLPAGDYQALRVVLGSGQGANWWCILFPPLCYLDVVGGRQTEWGVTPGGVLSAGNSGTAAGPGTQGNANRAGSTKVLSLDSLTPAQVADIQNVLGRALDSVAGGGGEVSGSTSPASSGAAAGSTKNTGAGVQVILSDVPASPDTDLVILVADTGTNRTEVRFFVFDRLRDLLRSLAESAPWLIQSLPEGAHSTPQG